jgi:excisionase family DNA binding protein
MSTLTSDPLYTPPEAAEHLRGKERTLERWRHTGGGPPFVKVGRAVRYRLSDLEAWLAQQRRQDTSASGASASPTE